MLILDLIIIGLLYNNYIRNISKSSRSLMIFMILWLLVCEYISYIYSFKCNTIRKQFIANSYYLILYMKNDFKHFIFWYELLG